MLIISDNISIPGEKKQTQQTKNNIFCQEILNYLANAIYRNASTVVYGFGDHIIINRDIVSLEFVTSLINSLHCLCMLVCDQLYQEDYKVKLCTNE